MLKGATSSGFKYNIDSRVMDDMEVIDAIADAESEDEYKRIAGLSILCKKILGPEKKRLYDHVRTEDGRVPTEDLVKELLEIFKVFGNEEKN